MTFTIDTGACSVVVLDVNGGNKRKVKAKISIDLAGTRFMREIALGLKREVGDEALFAVN